MIILMKGLNEEHYVHRCLSDFINEPFVDKIIVVDGESSDSTINELKKFTKVEYHIHKWLMDYHYQEVIQSMICLSYVGKGELFFIIDFDERMSLELKDTLNKINKGEIFIPDETVIHFTRRTFEVLREGDNAIIGDDGWPIISHQIGQYPDPQARLMRKTEKFHWINSPHHVPCGHTDEMVIDADILHFEKDNLQDRRKLEINWARCQAERKRLGLPPDRFETNPKLEISEYYEPETWR